ncbi:MAG: transcriptional regulator [Alphaproteobacteria bacterium HGW-Alphaproteobacteria-2]|nr:MAG: transcriptional regulator [Alphaproteobacteria bacterium HGW-Alphaproteobacteria-2]
MGVSEGTGTRIRAQRLARGLQQAALARSVGISASYLNLIEHDRRGIGGALLVAIARELGVEPAYLARGAETVLVEALQAAASRSEGTAAGLAPSEIARAEELATRLPGWARLVARQAEEIARLQETVAGLSDRLSHDPFLAETMHDILSSAAAIRSTASILAGTPDLEADWRARFQNNLLSDARRLSQTSAALLAHFDQSARSSPGYLTASEAVAGHVAAQGYHFPEIEAGADPEALAATEPMTGDGAARALLAECLLRYAEDARRMPLADFAEAAAACGWDPGVLAQHFGVGADAALRRLASLPPQAGRPDFGLVCCDGSGTLTLRKPLPGLPLPRFGAACPLWPLYQALIRPGLPLAETVEMPDGLRLRAHAVCLPRGGGFGAAAVVEVTMLLRFAAGQEGAARPVGTSCRVCPRTGCAARREPSILRVGGDTSD